MSLWRQLRHGLRALTDRTGTDREIADELSAYIEEATAALIESGLGPEEARLAARAQVGSLTAARDQVRAGGWEHALETLVSDIRYGIHGLWNAPAFALTSTLTLALGIGAS